jgi:hypothetical protein
MAEPYLEILTNTIANLKLNTSPETLLECKHHFRERRFTPMERYASPFYR